MNQYKIVFGKLTSGQVDGLSFLLKKLAASVRINLTSKRAYILSTIKWETANTYQPITEYGSDYYLKQKKYYPYIGRGYVQLTWLDNYYNFGKALGIDLVAFPSRANSPEIAWAILELGVTDGYGVQDPNFTKYTLEDFFTKEKSDYLNARKIINPGDKNSYLPIAENAKKVYDCLINSIINEKDIPEPK